MAYKFPHDIEQLVKNQMATGQYRCEEDLLRDALRTLEERWHAVVDEDTLVVEGIRRGFADMKAGRSVPLCEFDSQFRTQKSIPDDA